MGSNQTLPHYYGRITEILYENESQGSIITLDDVHWFSVGWSAKDAIDKVAEGDTVLIDLLIWPTKSLADIYIFRRDSDGAQIMREVTRLHITPGCQLSDTLQSISVGNR